MQVIKILFEGQTRKLPAVNYLRLIFEQTFQKLMLYTIKGHIGILGEDEDTTRLAKEQLEKAPQESKSGFLDKVKNFFGKKKAKEEAEALIV